MLKINEGILRPELSSEVLTQHDLCRMFEQQPQNLKRLPVEPDSVPALAKLPGARIKLKVAKALGLGRWCSLCHDPPRFALSLTPQRTPDKDCVLVLGHMISCTWNTLVSFRFQVVRSARK